MFGEYAGDIDGHFKGHFNRHFNRHFSRYDDALAAGNAGRVGAVGHHAASRRIQAAIAFSLNPLSMSHSMMLRS